jgi:hypothetical protein
MGSPLDFISSDGFRKKLVTRNLTPYAKAPNRPSFPINYEYIQSDSSVVDSPDQLIDEPSFANKLYPLNQWGSEGGYNEVPDVGVLNNSKSNRGEYGPGQQNAKILDQAEPESKNWKKVNAYSNGSTQLLDSGEFISSPNIIQSQGLYNNQPYPFFNNSTYSPLSILLSPDPQGDNGLLSQDSFIARLGAITLRKEFEERIARQIEQDTIGRVNLFSVDSATDVVNLITGRVPLIEPNWVITQSENPILAATNFILRLGGSILPISPIPGSYFDDGISLRQPTTVAQLQNAFRKSAVGNFVSTLLGTNLSGSQIFYNNTGSGQKSRLFKNIDYNKYKPSYDRTLFNRLAGLAVPSTTNNSTYYVGSVTAEPSRVFSPSGALPINSYGQEQQSPVFGPTELAQLYEGPSKEIKLGSNGPTYSNGGGIEGGLTWVSPKYKGNAGKKVGIGGEVTNEDEDFKPSSYNSTESTNLTFREGSILDNTQRIIDSQPQGGRRLQHVGNAIDQVSKVFNDGYKELTKGSRVLSYVGAIGQEVGTEYCRVFAKDIPYLQYNDLQKTDGTVTEGRRFSWSVLDKTYNLNISPNKQEGGQSSTNLINGPGGLSTNVGYAKKYMFSLENLAWRTSNTPGYSVSDLPICERGPNGGRVMWFPPYALTFSETISPSWNDTSFLGRPEPIYTYKNTSRTGTISWKIVVDHPSVLNLIVNKVLNNETNKVRVDSILESFFAGCRKYDLYELAKKYYTVNPNDLYQLQQAITSKELTAEQLEFSKQTIQTGVYSTNGSDQTIANPLDPNYFNKYLTFGFYFGNNYPYEGSVVNYTQEFNRYTSTTNREVYTNSPKNKDPQKTNNFFDNVVIPNYSVMTAFTNDLAYQLTQNKEGNVTVVLDSSCSAPATKNYNLELAKRRIESAIQFFSETESLKPFIQSGRLIVNSVNNRALGETTTSSPRVLKSSGQADPVNFEVGNTINCTDDDKNAVGGDSTVGTYDVFTYNAMACRRTFVSSIVSTLSNNIPKPQEAVAQYSDVLVGNVVTQTRKVNTVEESSVLRNNITKRVLRALLSECDYFETIKEETPMVFDNLKDKLKFFHPSFHSTTPEGLNSRLTFLQQCVRPGDTIPTIKEINGTQSLQYDNAINTSFGAPPVLVLRVGDFYNTKIIPTSLGITYENLDLNPEGIGVQPMIANITLGFNFVGGSGLKTSIDKLQNALTFNFYANTEMWDDRADVTDESYKVLDKEFLDAIQPQTPPTINQTTPNAGQSNNSTIGTIITNNIGEYETGTISYSDYMERFKNETQTYFQTIVNKLKETVNQYNNAVRQEWITNRNYTSGNFNVDLAEVKLFGKPSSFESNVNTIVSTYIDNIDDDEDEFIKFMSQPSKSFSTKVIRQLKENLSNLIKSKSSTFQNGVTSITQSLVNQEQLYLQTIGRINTMTFGSVVNTGTDGLQEPNGRVKIYVTSGTTEVDQSSQNVTNTRDELKEDIRKIILSLNTFKTLIQTETSFTYSVDKQNYSGRLVYEVAENGSLVDSSQLNVAQVFIPFSTKTKNLGVGLTLSLKNSSVFRRSYMLLSDDILDDKKYQTFKNQIIGNIINNNAILGQGSTEVEKYFDAYWIENTKPIFLDENNITKEFIDHMEKNVLKDFINYTPYSVKKRVFTYTTQNNGDAEKIESQKTLIRGLGASSNITTNVNKWNDGPSGSSTGVYVSKVKLN